MAVDRRLAEVLRTIKVPGALTNCVTFVDYLRKHVEADTKSQTPEEGLQRLNELVAHMLASHLELVNAMGTVDEQLRAIGQRLKQP
ncbi:hypothetical protein [Mycobacterium marinum]|uniref:hypothetical protein n=1 Tax=Mycobacterium marinum TaxID=1781 RepID=UPI0023599D11|nr:hypothetical protein [Mycobacterium marinum]MDC8974656.1 hypothetical protein [Mycobacterium marinum]